MSTSSLRLVAKALQARREGRLEDARTSLIEAVKLSREAGVPLDLARALTGLGQIDRDQHDLEAARRNYEEAVVLYRSAGGPLQLAHTIRHLADIYRNDLHPDLAEPLYHEALALYRSNQETPPLDLANAIRGLALLKGEARALWEEARDLYASAGVDAGVEEASRHLAQT